MANNKAARSRSTSRVYDDFALMGASQSEYTENVSQTPEFEQDEAESEEPSQEDTIKDTPQQPSPMPPLSSYEPRPNPIITTTYHKGASLADTPEKTTHAPVGMRGQQKFLAVHILSSDTAAGQMVTLDITTNTYLDEVLEQVCRKRNLDKANHVLKLPNSGQVVFLDRAVSSIGNVTELELHRRRFATDGPLTISGSPGSSSPKPQLHNWDAPALQKGKKTKIMTTHPLAREALRQEDAGNTKKYQVWRKQQLRFTGMNERLFSIDGEYIYIQPASGGQPTRDGGKTTTVHFSNVVGCSVSRRHPTNFKLLVYKATESKRYDFEAKNTQEAAEIEREIRKGVAPYQRGN